MSDESSLRSSIRSKEIQKENREREKRAIEEKIRRLQEAERKVKAEKTIIKEMKGQVHKQRDADSQWKGNLRDKYHSFVGNDFKQDYNSHYDGVDNLLDDIVRKISELQNEASDLSGIIGALANAINSLWGEIRALFN